MSEIDKNILNTLRAKVFLATALRSIGMIEDAIRFENQSEWLLLLLEVEPEMHEIAKEIFDAQVYATA